MLVSVAAFNIPSIVKGVLHIVGVGRHTAVVGSYVVGGHQTVVAGHHIVVGHHIAAVHNLII